MDSGEILYVGNWFHDYEVVILRDKQLGACAYVEFLSVSGRDGRLTFSGYLHSLFQQPKSKRLLVKVELKSNALL